MNIYVFSERVVRACRKRCLIPQNPFYNQSNLSLLHPPHKFCVHACMTPVFSGRTKLGICLPNLTMRGGKMVFILCHPTKNEPRKRTKGSNTLWKPAVRLCGRYALAPHNTTQKQTVSALAFASSKNLQTRK